MENKIQLKQHNLETYNLIKNSFKTKNHICVVQATGTGKSFLIAKTIEDMNFKKVLFLSPSLHIINGFKDNFPFLKDNIDFMTYKKLTYVKDLQLFFKENEFDFIVLDEYHRCGAKTWGNSVKRLISHYQNTKILGVTATPIRFLDGCRNMSEELFNSNPITDISLAKALNENILPEPKYILSYYDIEGEIIKIKETIGNNRTFENKIQPIINNLDKLVNIEDVLKKNITNERKFIVFCKSISHAKEMSVIIPRWFENIGFNTKIYSVYSCIDGKNLEDEVENFRNSKPKNNQVDLLFTVNILNEGVHIEDVDGLIFLRKTKSPIIMYQQLGRALKSGETKKPLIFDLVSNIIGLSFFDNTSESKEKNINAKKRNLKEYFVNSDIEIIDYTKPINEMLAKVELANSESTWENFLNEIKEFKKEYGHCNMPTNHKVYKKALRIKKEYQNGLLDKNKIDDLELLGFDWSINIYNDEAWNEMYDELTKFYNENKHSNVPRSYKNKKLAYWVQTQRRYKDTMPKERIEKLLNIDFQFEIGKKRNEEEWNCMFNKLLSFKKEFNHVNVSSRYEDKKLANWVNSQRKAYKANKISQERYEKLIKVGFNFPSNK